MEPKEPFRALTDCRNAVLAHLSFARCASPKSASQGATGHRRHATGSRFHALLEQQFLAYEAGLTTRCKDIHPDWGRANAHIYGTVELDKDGYPYKAAWAEQVPGTACGQQRRFRALVLVRNGKLDTQSMLPGESETSTQLALDVRDPLLAAAEGFARDIKPTCAIDVLDTHLVDNASPPNPWQEVWLVNICGHRLNVPITFIPDATGGGTSYSISSAKITVATGLTASGTTLTR